MTATQKDLDNVIEWTKNYFETAGLKKAVVGLSGGIDSAVMASICARALGKENVVGAILPCQSQQIDEKLASQLVKNLDLYGGYIHLDLEETFDKLWKTYREEVSWEDSIPDTYNKLVPANMKARLRMTTLYTLAGHVGGLVVGTTNKTEALLGYATKYGDGGVDIEPLQDFLKTEIYELAELLGDIPQGIIDRAPSAGLWDGQTDEDELGITYANIDAWIVAVGAPHWRREAAVLSESKEQKLLKLIEANKHKDLGLPMYKR